MMTPNIGTLFEEGPVARLVKIAAVSRTPEEDLIRFVRIVRGSAQADWLMPVSATASLLETAARELDHATSPAAPREFGENLARAARETPGPQYLRMLADLIRPYDVMSLPSYLELPMAPWESLVAFPSTYNFGLSWIEPGESESVSAAIREGIESEHPARCRVELASLASEIQRMVQLFPSDEELRQNVRHTISWATHATLDEILSGAKAHAGLPH